MNGLYPPGGGEKCANFSFQKQQTSHKKQKKKTTEQKDDSPHTHTNTRTKRKKKQRRKQRTTITRKQRKLYYSINMYYIHKKYQLLYSSKIWRRTNCTMIVNVTALGFWYAGSVALGPSEAGCLAGAPGWGPAVAWAARLGMVERRMRCAFPSVAKSKPSTNTRHIQNNKTCCQLTCKMDHDATLPLQSGSSLCSTGQQHGIAPTG